MRFPRMAWLQKELPFELMGFGCDGLHELWDEIPHGGIPLDALSGALKEVGFEHSSYQVRPDAGKSQPSRSFLHLDIAWD